MAEQGECCPGVLPYVELCKRVISISLRREKANGSGELFRLAAADFEDVAEYLRLPKGSQSTALVREIAQMLLVEVEERGMESLLVTSEAEES